MGTKRKFKKCWNPPTKHRYSLRSKSKWKRFEMENFCARFPCLKEEIFGQLDYQSLARCRELNEFWQNDIDEQRIFIKRKIKSYIGDSRQFSREWIKILKKSPSNILRKLEFATHNLKGSTPDQWSPLHIAAKADLNLFKEILLKLDEINPANQRGETPLHCAVQNGHFDICKFIIENVNQKNPPDNLGFTPLHYAAMFGHLRIYKVILKNVDDKNPVDEMGITPLECAIQQDRPNICRFINDKVDTSQLLDIDVRIKICREANRGLREYQNFLKHTKICLQLCK